MFDVRPMPQQVPAELIELALSAEPATIGHFRTLGFPRPTIKLMTEPKRIAGTAVTLALPGADSTLLHHTAGLLRPGDVLLIDRLGDTIYAAVGGGVALVLRKAGVAGVVIDGPCTDPEEIRQSGLSLWATSVSSITTRVYGNAGVLNRPISIGGAVVTPGDLVIADEAGIAILSAGEAEQDIRQAIRLQQWERQYLPKVNAKNRLGDVTGASKLVADKLIPAA